MVIRRAKAAAIQKPQSQKLDNTLREKIASLMIADWDDRESKAITDADNGLALRVLALFLGPHADLFAACPNEWFEETDAMQWQVLVPCKDGLSFGHSHRQAHFSEPKAIPYIHNYNVDDKDVEAEFQRIKATLTEHNKRRDKLRAEIMGILTRISTFTQLRDEWPEAHEILKARDLIPEEGAVAPGTLEALNKELGIANG